MTNSTNDGTTDNDDLKKLERTVEDSLTHLEKRLDDLKWFFGISIGLFALFAGLLSINYNAERGQLERFQAEVETEIEETLGARSAVPEFAMSQLNGEKLEGAVVTADVLEDSEGLRYLQFGIIMRNVGKANTGQYSMKLYTTEDIQFTTRSTDESDYQYETYFSAERNEYKEFPPGLSLSNYLFVYPTNIDAIPNGTYPALLKVYYGQDQVSSTFFRLEIRR